jgi:hypothetical protein
LDLGIGYRFKTDNAGSFDLGANANILFNYKFRASTSVPYLQYARVFTDSTTGGSGYEGLLPSYTVKPYINYSYKSISASIIMTYYPTVTAPGTLFGTGASTGNAYTINGLKAQIPSYFKTDLSIAYTLPTFGMEWLRSTTLTVGANNVFNKSAPYVPGDGSFVAENNTDKGAYDIIGRFMFVELKKRF